MNRFLICASYFGAMACISSKKATLHIVKGAEQRRPVPVKKEFHISDECLLKFALYLEAIKKETAEIGMACLVETEVDDEKKKLRYIVEPHVTNCDKCYQRLRVLSAELSGA
jgi:hypothetical protein